MGTLAALARRDPSRHDVSTAPAGAPVRGCGASEGAPDIRAVGNQALQRLRRSGFARSEAVDPAEREAGAPEVVARTLDRSGQQLPEPVRRDMEAAFGRDFGAVRVHRGPEAAESAAAIGARAYTHGNDVVFGTASPPMTSSEGQRVLAHELTHVVQQTGTLEPIRRELLDDAGDALGSVAETIAEVAGKVVDPGEETSDRTVGSDETTGAAGAVTEEEPAEVGEVVPAVAGCDADQAVGFGNGTGTRVSLHGRTVSNYNHGRPIPAPFPSTVTITTGTVRTRRGTQNVFSAHGTFDVAFAANPAITLPSVPAGLRPCQARAVQAFIDGPLTAHEEDHRNAFTSNYDGTFTAAVDVDNIQDTPVYRQRAMENPVNNEDVTRTTAANAASAALDPWTRTVPGMDCED